MRFWTIQPRAVWKQMERGDSVRVDSDHPKYGGKRPWQYEWLSAALRRNRSGFDGGWPWWLSCEKPDLDRLRSTTQPGGREQTMIELDLPEDRCAIFPLWIWETIYTGNFVAFTRESLDNWRQKLQEAIPEPHVRPLPEPWQARLETSWELMFDNNVDQRCWYRDDEIPAEGDEMHALMKGASEGMAGLTQELRERDTVNATLFTTTE